MRVQESDRVNEQMVLEFLHLSFLRAACGSEMPSTLVSTLDEVPGHRKKLFCGGLISCTFSLSLFFGFAYDWRTPNGVEENELFSKFLFNEPKYVLTIDGKKGWAHFSLIEWCNHLFSDRLSLSFASVALFSRLFHFLLSILLFFHAHSSFPLDVLFRSYSIERCNRGRSMTKSLKKWFSTPKSVFLLRAIY